MTWRGHIVSDGVVQDLSYDPTNGICHLIIKDYSEGILNVSFAGVVSFSDAGAKGRSISNVSEVVSAGIARIMLLDDDNEALLDVSARSVTVTEQ